MKRLLVAALVFTSASAWAVEDLVLQNLKAMHSNVRRILEDQRWAHGDEEMHNQNWRDLEIIHNQLEIIQGFVSPDDPAYPRLDVLVKLKYHPTPADVGFKDEQWSVVQLDTFRRLEMELTEIVKPTVKHEGADWRPTAHGKLVVLLSETLHDLLRSMTFHEESRPRVTDLTAIDKVLHYWTEKAFFLVKLSQDENLKSRLYAIGRMLEDRQSVVPTLAHPNAPLVQYRNVLAKAVIEMDNLERALDLNGLNCDLKLQAAAPTRRRPLHFLQDSQNAPSELPSQE